MSVAQLVEYWSPKPGVKGSSPFGRAEWEYGTAATALDCKSSLFEFVGSSPTTPT